MANSEDNLKNAILNSKNHKYVVKIRYGNSSEYFERNYFYSFGSIRFEEDFMECSDIQELPYFMK